jgi:hypothetical protein
MFRELISYIGKPMRKERTLFNGDLLDQKREDVLVVMNLMGMNR